MRVMIRLQAYPEEKFGKGFRTFIIHIYERLIAAIWGMYRESKQ
jgi:hypothetical protein